MAQFLLIFLGKMLAYPPEKINVRENDQKRNSHSLNKSIQTMNTSLTIYIFSPF